MRLQTYEDPIILRNNLLKSLTERTQQRLKSFYSTTTKEVEELMETNQVCFLRSGQYDLTPRRI